MTFFPGDAEVDDITNNVPTGRSSSAPESHGNATYQSLTNVEELVYDKVMKPHVHQHLIFQ